MKRKECVPLLIYNGIEFGISNPIINYDIEPMICLLEFLDFKEKLDLFINKIESKTNDIIIIDIEDAKFLHKLNYEYRGYKLRVKQPN